MSYSKLQYIVDELIKGNKAVIKEFLKKEEESYGSKYQNILEFLIKNVHYTYLEDLPGVNIVMLNGNKYCVMEFAQKQSRRGNDLRVVYDVTDMNKPVRIGESEYGNELLEQTITRALTNYNNRLLQSNANKGDSNQEKGPKNNEEQSN